MANGILYADPSNTPLSPLTSRAALLPNSYYLFYLAKSTIPAIVYQVGDLSIAYPTNKVTADVNGVFAGVFLDPTKVYRTQWFDQFGSKLMDVDTYISALTPNGTSQLTINPLTGSVTITPTAPGGAGASLTVIARQSGIALNSGASGFAPGSPELQLFNTGATGATTATFAGNNKPGGVVNGGVAQWMPINVNGVIRYIPLWI